MGEFVDVWRVENEHGCGPYNQGGKGNIHSLLHDIQNGKYVKIPLPQEDAELSAAFNGNGNSTDYLSGFPSLEKYTAWFDSDEIRNILEENNFVLRQYRVPAGDVITGKAQVLFNRDSAIPGTTKRCNEIETASARAQPPPDMLL